MRCVLLGGGVLLGFRGSQPTLLHPQFTDTHPTTPTTRSQPACLHPTSCGDCPPPLLGTPGGRGRRREPLLPPQKGHLLSRRRGELEQMRKRRKKRKRKGSLRQSLWSLHPRRPHRKQSSPLGVMRMTAQAFLTRSLVPRPCHLSAHNLIRAPSATAALPAPEPGLPESLQTRAGPGVHQPAMTCGSDCARAVPWATLGQSSGCPLMRLRPKCWVLPIWMT